MVKKYYKDAGLIAVAQHFADKIVNVTVELPPETLPGMNQKIFSQTKALSEKIRVNLTNE